MVKKLGEAYHVLPAAQHRGMQWLIYMHVAKAVAVNKGIGPAGEEASPIRSQKTKSIVQKLQH
jgi:hypothetical protein